MTKQEKVIRAAMSYTNNECSCVDQSSNFMAGVIWTLKKLRKSGVLENIDENEVYEKICDEKLQRELGAR